MSVWLADEQATVAAGAKLARKLLPGLVIFLEGDLGAGKTTFCRGFLTELGHEGAVKSPTYTLVEPYQLGDWQLYHFDLYRLGDPEELEYMGIRDYLNEQSVCLIEWPERGRGILPSPDIRVRIQVDGRARRLELSAASPKGEQVAAGFIPERE